MEGPGNAAAPSSPDGATAELGFDCGAEACEAQGMLALEEQADCFGFCWIDVCQDKAALRRATRVCG